MLHFKVSVVLVAAVLAIAPYGQATLPNLVLNPRFVGTPTDPSKEIAPNWAYMTTASATTAYVSQLSPTGVRMESANGTAVAGAGFSTTDRGIYQAVPVVAGATYQVNASWRGFFNTSGATYVANNSATGVYVNVAFGTSSTGPWTGDYQLLYKKLGYNREIDSWNVPRSTMAPTMQTSYSWTTWENANLSPATNHLIALDTCTVPAGNTFMRVRFAFFTTALDTQNVTLPGNGQAWVEIDNVSVTSCQGALGGDIDGDCNVDFNDFSQMANTWLMCGNSSNSSLCW